MLVALTATRIWNDMAKDLKYRAELCALFDPPSDEPAWKWIEDHVELGSNSELKRFDFELVPMHRWIHEQLQKQQVRFFTMMVCAQAGKTVNMLAHLLYKIKNQPRDVAWYTDTGIKAVADYKTKIKPFFENARGLGALFPKERERRSQKLIQFESMNMHVLGAESASNRESITLFEAYCDEVRNYVPGALTQIDNRMKTIRSSKRVVFSSAGNEHDELHRAFNEGTRHLFYFQCPHCKHRQPFRFGRDATTMFPEPREYGGFVWDTNEVTKPSEDVWNFTELAKTVRYECENKDCRHHFTKADRWRLLATLEPVQTNPHADPNNISVSFWEAYMPWQSCDWDNIVIKFLRAQLAAKRGDFEPLRVFVCETLGEPWRPPGGHTINEGEVMARCGEYATGERMQGDGLVDVITCDFQLGYLYFVHRQWKKNEGSRLVDCGTLPTFDDLRKYQLANGVRDRCVFIDCAYKPSEVFDACASYGRWVVDMARPQAPFKGRAWDGWTPCKGEEYNDYTVAIAGNERIKTHWRIHDQEVKVGRAGVSPIIRVLLFSKPWFRERLFLYAVKGAVPWHIPKNIRNEYVRQMGNVERRELLDANGQVRGYEWHEKGRHDYPDCEQMQLAVAEVADMS